MILWRSDCISSVTTKLGNQRVKETTTNTTQLPNGFLYPSSLVSSVTQGIHVSIVDSYDPNPIHSVVQVSQSRVDSMTKDEGQGKKTKKRSGEGGNKDLPKALNERFEEDEITGLFSELNLSPAVTPQPRDLNKKTIRHKRFRKTTFTFSS